MRSATGFKVPIIVDEAGFNPRTPCGVRPDYWRDKPGLTGFQSTHSLRSATDFPGFHAHSIIVSIHALLAECDMRGVSSLLALMSFNPRTPCGVRLTFLRAAIRLWPVSIHALLAECDKNAGKHAGRQWSFNPRTPCGVRPISRALAVPTLRFQSTHSLRSAT